MKERNWPKNEARYWLSILENPSSDILFNHIDIYEPFLIFWVYFWDVFGSTFELSSPGLRGETAGIPALGSSHIPCSVGPEHIVDQMMGPILTIFIPLDI